MKTKKNKPNHVSQPIIINQPSKIQNKHFLPKRNYVSANLAKLQNKKQSFPVSLFVNLPVYEEYKRIDLNKTTTYQRINHQKSRTINLSNFEKQKSVSQIQIQDSKGWKTEILKYIKLKQKSVEKHDDEYDGYPLMRLSKKNELLRKIKTNYKFAGKPEVVAKLQTEQLFEEKPLVSKTNPLPKITRQTKKLMSKRQRKFDKTSSLVNEEMKRQFHFREVLEKANKSEKVLVNFIGNYFRQKFCPERRYSHQIPKKEYKEEIIKLQIKNIFHSNHNYSTQNETLENT